MTERSPMVESDHVRRFLWILADRNPGGLLISGAELVATPHLPGLSVQHDPFTAGVVIRALPKPTERKPK